MYSKERLHIGHLVKSIFDESGLTVVEFARRIHCTHSNVYSIFERNDIGVEQLVNISMALNHNFLDDVQRIVFLDSSILTRRLSIEFNVRNMDSQMVDKIDSLLKELVDICH